MRRLVVDVGNSKIAAAVVADTSIAERFSQAYGDSKHAGGPERAVAALGDWTALRLRDGGLLASAVASVVPTIGSLWLELWKGRDITRRIPLIEIDHQSPLPFELEIREAESVGADRLCNVAAAVRRGFSDAIILDLGTAHTYDILRDGAFIGGLIAPGAASSQAGLVQRAAQLPPVAFEDPGILAGNRTVDSIQAGGFHQAIGGVFYLLHRLERRYPRMPVLLTGGLAPHFLPQLPKEVRFLPELTLEGAVAILDRSGLVERSG